LLLTYEDGTQDKYVYNADGLLTKSVNRRGQEIAYEYDNRYQITKETHSDGAIIEYKYTGSNVRSTYISDDDKTSCTNNFVNA